MLESCSYGATENGKSFDDLLSTFDTYVNVTYRQWDSIATCTATCGNCSKIGFVI